MNADCSGIMSQLDDKPSFCYFAVEKSAVGRQPHMGWILLCVGIHKVAAGRRP